MNKITKLGEIYYADLSPFIGSEQGGIRPVIIISNDIGPTVTVCPVRLKLIRQNSQPM